MNKKIKTLLVSSMVVLAAVTTLGCNKVDKFDTNENGENYIENIYKNDEKIGKDTMIKSVKEYFNVDISSKQYKIRSYGKASEFIQIIAIDKDHKNKFYSLEATGENVEEQFFSLYKKGIEGETVETTRDEKLDIAKKFLVEKDFATSENEIEYVGIDTEASGGGDKVGFQFKLNNKVIVVSVSNTDSEVCHFAMYDE